MLYRLSRSLLLSLTLFLLIVVRKSLEEEKARYTELQGIWTRANLSFISTQDELKQKLEDIESSDEK